MIASSALAQEIRPDFIEYQQALTDKPGFVVSIKKDSLRTVNSKLRLVLPSGLAASADTAASTGVSTMELRVDSSRSEKIFGRNGRTTIATLKDNSLVEGRMTLSEVGDSFYGLIETPSGEHFVLKNGSNGEAEINFVVQQDEGQDTIAPISANPVPLFDSNMLNSSMVGDGNVAVVDVLVVYTQSALAQFGGNKDNILALISNAVTVTNQAFIVSADNQTPAVQLHVVGTFLLSSPDSGDLITELTNLSEFDGKNDEVFAARDASGADIVVELSVSTGPFCGLAYVPQSFAFDSDIGFASVDTSCAVGNLSFPHEVGHLFGLNHDHDHAENPFPLRPYAFGLNFTGTNNLGYRTIMAYRSNTALSEERLAYFSNPNTVAAEAGTPTGIAGNGPTAANNASLLTETAPLVANYRPTVQGGLGGVYGDDFSIGKISAKFIKPKTRSSKSVPYFKFSPEVSGPAGHELRVGFKVGSNTCSKRLQLAMPESGTTKLSNNLKHIDRKTTLTILAFNSVGITTDIKKITLKVKNARKGLNQDHPKYFKTLCKDLARTRAN